jgi:hypothetical protein
MRGLPGAAPHLWLAMVVGTALTAWACSSNPPTAVLYLVVHGEGHVAVTRASNPDSCTGNSCSSASLDGGALELPYASDSTVTLQAEPSAGWQFTSWQVSISGGGSSPVISTQPTVIIGNAGDGMSVLATFSEAGAPADAATAH